MGLDNLLAFSLLLVLHLSAVVPSFNPGERCTVCVKLNVLSQVSAEVEDSPDSTAF